MGNKFEGASFSPPEETREEVLGRASEAQKKAAERARAKRASEGTVDLTEELEAATESTQGSKLERIAQEIEATPAGELGEDSAIDRERPFDESAFGGR